MINITDTTSLSQKQINTSQQVNLNYYLNTLQTEGFMAYEYNPLHNYRLTEASDTQQAGSIVDLDTEELQFNLENPVEIEVQPAYDDSVNLILNDGKNQPRLINSRFSQRQLGKYEIVDRIGDNDTNLYDSGTQFSQDTSLYKRVQDIPKVVFKEVIPTGNLKVGNYVLYFRYEDADGNETDFVAESGIISIFKGSDKDPFSIDGGIADMLAYKTIHVTLQNIDSAYDYVKVYVVRTSAQKDASRYTEVYKLNKRFVVRHKQCNIIITGNETKEDLSINDINMQYFTASSAKKKSIFATNKIDKHRNSWFAIFHNKVTSYERTESALRKNTIGKIEERRSNSLLFYFYALLQGYGLVWRKFSGRQEGHRRAFGDDYRGHGRPRRRPGLRAGRADGALGRPVARLCPPLPAQPRRHR